MRKVALLEHDAARAQFNKIRVGVVTADEPDADEFGSSELQQFSRRTVGQLSHARTPSLRLKP